MDSVRTYGSSPFRVAVLHGGPGAPGEVAPVARRLGVTRGALEPLQAADSLDGQVEELRATLERHAEAPVVLIGWSWGAVLGFIFAARHPSYVSKLILVSSAPFTDAYAAGIWQTRMARLSDGERAEAEVAIAALGDPNQSDKMPAFELLGRVLHRADSYEPFTDDSEVLAVQPEVFEKVWGQAEAMRRSGRLLELGRQIECPVVAIHGDYDPHPAEGVRAPLTSEIEDFRFILLERCGHTPWIETHAHERFYDALEEELATITLVPRPDQVSDLFPHKGKPVYGNVEEYVERERSTWD